MDEALPPFGFSVSRTEPAEHPDGTRSDDLWAVNLPHQCDRWDIAGERWSGITHANAVAELDQFIAEAIEARDALVARRELRALDDWDSDDA